mmetsp:Transcript_49389/g.111866  ORF Transcript_49389/g.111866 Transcript_49389/m.111866 type:complete len:205 (-) Transcript_49389:266-880(-)
MESFALVEQHVDLEALCLALEAKATCEELLKADLVVPIPIQKLEEDMGLGDVQFQGSEVGLHRGHLQMRLEFLPTEEPGTVSVCFSEEGLDLHRVVLHRSNLVLHDDVPVLVGHGSCGCNEGAHHHVQHADYHEEDIEREHGLVCPMDVHQRLHGVFPIDAPGDGHEQGQHRQGHTAVVLQHLLGRRGADALKRGHVFSDAIEE